MDVGMTLVRVGLGPLEPAVRRTKRTYGLEPATLKLPIILSVLRAILQHLSQTLSLSAWDRQVVAASFSVSFACFLRCGEVIWDAHSPAQLFVGSVV